MKISIQRVSESAHLPTQAYEGSIGFDCMAHLPEGNVWIPTGESATIPLGFRTSMPKNCAGLIYARSGLGCKQGIRPRNCVGVIDPDYRGEWVVQLENTGVEEFCVSDGMRVCQAVIHELPGVELVEVDELDETLRGEGKFGSSGL